MQDNATPHISQSTLKFLEDKNIDVLEWAPHSPDCNPIERIAIKRVWEDLEIELIQKSVRSFPKRLIQVVANRGGPTRTY